MSQKGLAPILFLIPVFILIATVLGVIYYFSKLPVKLPFGEPKACTQEAKICLDGSSVGRTGPNCEFAPCPKTSSKVADDTADWKTYENTKLGISFKIPTDWDIQEFDFSTNPGMKDISMGFKGKLRPVTLSVAEEQIDASELNRPYSSNELYSVDKNVYNSKRYTVTEYTLIFKNSLAGNKSIVGIIEFNKRLAKWELIDFSLQDIFNKIISTFKFLDNSEDASAEGQFCGGFAGKECPLGYTCILDGKYPDAGGKCAKD